MNTPRFSAQKHSIVLLWCVFDEADGLCVPGLFTHEQAEAEDLADACNRLDAIALAPSTSGLYSERLEERLAYDKVVRLEAGLRNARGQQYLILRGRMKRAIDAAAEQIPADLQLKTHDELNAERRDLLTELGADGATALEAWEAAYKLPCPDRETARRRSAIIRRLAGLDAETTRRASTPTDQPALFGADL